MIQRPLDLDENYKRMEHSFYEISNRNRLTYLICFTAGNKAVPPPYLISSHNVHLLVECHNLCKNESICYGFNFRVRPSSKYTVNCQLSNSTVKMNMTKMKDGPWIYWEDILVSIQRQNE